MSYAENSKLDESEAEFQLDSHSGSVCVCNLSFYFSVGIWAMGEWSGTWGIWAGSKLYQYDKEGV